MEDRRREQRTTVNRTVTVEDAVYKEVLGVLTDISPQGLRISGEESLEVGDELRLRLLLPAPVFGKNAIIATAVCVWSKYDAASSQWLSGFQFSEVSRNDANLILGLILDSSKPAVE
jgi:hypothetical protein